jgi:hypothetical protein
MVFGCAKITCYVGSQLADGADAAVQSVLMQTNCTNSYAVRGFTCLQTRISSSQSKNQLYLTIVVYIRYMIQKKKTPT